MATISLYYIKSPVKPQRQKSYTPTTYENIRLYTIQFFK